MLEEGPSEGTLSLRSDGSFTYTPVAGFSGEERFTYRASDGEEASDPATVILHVLVPPPGLQITKKVSAKTVQPGELLRYTLSYFYDDNRTSDGVTVIESYDPATTFVSADPAPDAGTDNVWTLGELAPGESGEIFVTVRVNGGVSEGTIIKNSVLIQSGEDSDRAEETVRVMIEEEDTGEVCSCCVGGWAAGKIVEAVIDPDQCPELTLFLNRQAADREGRIYISVETPSIPDWKDYLWLHPGGREAPPYVTLAKADSDFLPQAGDNYFYKGLLSPAPQDLTFVLKGLSGIRGHALVFKSWWVEEGMQFNPQNLKLIQSVRVTFGCSVGGAVMGPKVAVIVDTALCDPLKVHLSRRAPDGFGKPYVSLETPSIPSWKDLLWFRPREVKTPPYLMLVQGPFGFLPGAGDAYYYTGPLNHSAPDLIFGLEGLDEIAGHTVSLKSQRLDEGAPFNAGNLITIQDVEVTFR